MSRTQQETMRALSGARLADTDGRKAPNGEPYDHRFVASTDRLASDRGVILLDAWRLDAWMQRPRWIANHDIMGAAKLTEVSLGRGVWAGVESGLDKKRVGPSGKALVAYVRYATTPFAQEVKTLYEEGGLDDVSVRWDWRTEQLRNPTVDERAIYGDDVNWVATRVDLLELSAVLLGADPGAQHLRSDVEAALERCRAAGHEMGAIEQMLVRRRGRIVSGPGLEQLDLLGVSRTIVSLHDSVRALATWHEQMAPVKQLIDDELSTLATLIATAVPMKEFDVPELLASDEEKEEYAKAKNAYDEEFAAFEAVTEAKKDLVRALTRFDLAQDDVGPAIQAIDDALRRLADTLDLADLIARSAKDDDGDREGFTLDIDAVLADGESPFERLYQKWLQLREVARDK